MEKKIKWLETLNNCEYKLDSISETLGYYSSNFYAVGNQKIGNLLSKLSEELGAISDEISRSTGTIVNKQVKDSFNNSYNMMQAALAGVKIATDAKKE